LPFTPFRPKLGSMKLLDLFSNYFTVRAELIAAVRNLTPEQMAFTAPNHPNSIGWLLVHIAETEYWWIADVALGQADHSRYETFKPDMNLPDVLTLLDEMHELTRHYLDVTELEDWDTIFYPIPDRAEKVSARWLVWHVVEHQARHRGQVFMLLRMQGLDVPHV